MKNNVYKITRKIPQMMACLWMYDEHLNAREMSNTKKYE